MALPFFWCRCKSLALISHLSATFRIIFGSKLEQRREEKVEGERKKSFPELVWKKIGNKRDRRRMDMLCVAKICLWWEVIPLMDIEA